MRYLALNLSHVRNPDGYYLLVNAAGVMGSVGGPPSYPKWLRTYLIVLVSIVWAVAVFAQAFVDNVTIDWWVHGIMGVGMASLFSVEFGGIRLVNKKDTPDA